MATELVPIALGLSDRDVITLWAPPWRAEDGEEYQAFLGLDEDLYAFPTAVDLALFARGDNSHDLDDHPSWPEVSEWEELRFEPTEPRSYDLVGVFEIVANSPTEESVQELDDALSIVKALAEVCELDKSQAFFTDEPLLELVSDGIDNFYDREGLKTWTRIGKHIAKKWEKVLDEIEGVISTPEISATEEEREETQTAFDEQLARQRMRAEEIIREEEIAEARAAGDLWERVGIDPISINTSERTWYTLRCYIGDSPLFLGSHKRIFVFKTPRALARYLVDDHAHALAELSTWEQVQLAATDGAVDVKVEPDNAYDLTGFKELLSSPLEDIDSATVDLAAELVSDVADFAEDDTLAASLDTDREIGRWFTAVIDNEEETEAAQIDEDALEVPDPEAEDETTEDEKIKAPAETIENVAAESAERSPLLENDEQADALTQWYEITDSIEGLLTEK